MNEHDQRIAIAEACGWYDCHCLEGGNVPFGKPDDDWNRDVKAGILDQQQHEEELPDYLYDLNAMAQAEEVAQWTLMNADQWEEYGRWLVKLVPDAVVTNSDGTPDYYDVALVACASADRRAEAFLRTIGKWKD